MALYEQLQRYTEGELYPMHMPGHKRNPRFAMTNPYGIDVTEVEGTDNLHHAKGIIREEMERVRAHYGTKATYFLVNGSTCGILAAISACCRRGDRILVARNCHLAVYHAIYLLELEPVYLYPFVDPLTGICLGIMPEQVRAALTQESFSCAVITSPTYEGVVSDVANIADMLHEREIPLVVDEAHGAHFAWSGEMPMPAMAQGADLVVESLHKTLPALTQTALLHRGTDRVSGELLERYLAIYETSSPSYVLMSSISQCIAWLEKEGGETFRRHGKCLKKFRERAAGWKHLTLWDGTCTGITTDPSRLVITTGDTALTGVELEERLRREHQIQVEMAAANYVIAITSVADTEDGMERFSSALAEIDRELEGSSLWEDGGQMQEKFEQSPHGEGSRCAANITIYEAMNREYEAVPLSDGMGRVSAEYAMIYPPGIPFLVPGEEITKEVLAQLWRARECGLALQGLADETGEQIRVLSGEDRRKSE